MTESLSLSPRTVLGRLAEKGRTDREELHALLDEALDAHVGVDAGGYPLVLPTAFAVDLDGPDAGGTLYVHGSVAAGWLTSARRQHGLRHDHRGGRAGRWPARRSTSSMNYRSAVVIGDGARRRRAPTSGSTPST